MFYSSSGVGSMKTRGWEHTPEYLGLIAPHVFTVLGVKQVYPLPASGMRPIPRFHPHVSLWSPSWRRESGETAPIRYSRIPDKTLDGSN